MEPDKKLLGEDRRALLVEWGHHIEGLERMDGFCALEMDQAKEALLYLRGVLGDDFLWRCSAGDPYVARHPILMLLANFAPCSRRGMTRFAGYLRVLEGSQNLDKVLARLHDMSQFNHDGLLIKAAAKLVEQGLRARFEPTMHVEDNQRQPDLRLEEPVTGETLFLEVVTQAPAQREREVTDTNSAVIGAVIGISYELCFSARWHQTPSKQVLGGILERIRVGAVRALNERTLVAVQEEDILDMALCHRDDKTRLLDPWSEARGLSGGFLGPRMVSNDTARLKGKISKKQAQLPRDAANVIVILAADAFIRAGGVRRVINEVEERVFRYDHVHLVIVHGECIDNQAIPFTGREREHRFTRRIVDGKTENDLLLINRHSRTKLSPDLLEKFQLVF